MVIARAGEEIVCPRGTLCGRMVRDVNEQLSEDDFILFEDASLCDGRQFVRPNFFFRRVDLVLSL